MSNGLYSDAVLARHYDFTNSYRQRLAALNQGITTTQPTNSVQQAAYATDAEGNTCTDGNDDGKIGFFSAIGNAIEGIGKGIVKGIKGMFTNKEGKFSLGKTLLSVGLAALCICVPAVGAVACGIGCVVGAVQAGKGIYNAATAETDAQAKAAWENIGEGTATAVSSYFGAKASVGAMKAASTAAKASTVDDTLALVARSDDNLSALQVVDKTDDMMNAVSKTDEMVNAVDKATDFSALGNLDDNATMAQKASAFWKDAVSSTKNNFAKGKTTLAAGKEAVEYKKAENAYKKIDQSGALTDDELRAIREFEIRDAMKSDEAAAFIDKIDDVTRWKDGKVSQMKKFGENVKAQEGIKGKYTYVKENMPSPTNKLKSTNTGEYLSGIKQTKTGFLTKQQKTDVMGTIKNIKLSDLGTALNKDGQAIFAHLQQYNNLPQTISQFGYNNTMQVLETIYGFNTAAASV